MHRGRAELSQALTAAVDHIPAGSTAGEACTLKKNDCFLSSDFPYPRGPSFRVLLVTGKGGGLLFHLCDLSQTATSKFLPGGNARRIRWSQIFAIRYLGEGTDSFYGLIPISISLMQPGSDSGTLHQA